MSQDICGSIKDEINKMQKYLLQFRLSFNCTISQSQYTAHISITKFYSPAPIPTLKKWMIVSRYVVACLIFTSLFRHSICKTSAFSCFIFNSTVTTDSTHIGWMYWGDWLKWIVIKQYEFNSKIDIIIIQIGRSNCNNWKLLIKSVHSQTTCNAKCWNR